MNNEKQLLISKLIEKEILSRYGSIRKFTEKYNWAYTTIYTGIQKGFGGMGIQAFNKLCQDLNIDINSLLKEQIIAPIEIQDKDIDFSIKNKILKLNNEELIQLSDYLDFLLSRKNKQ
ncbi:MAG: hypothetical protein RBS24_00010 [Bacilli bacterium]|nr:hypothetical protein [Bacilli bacterium]